MWIYSGSTGVERRAIGMTTDTLVDQELIVHAYAPVAGPMAGLAAAQLRAIWERGRALLGLSEPIPGLPTRLPDDLAADHVDFGGAPVLAAQQDLAADFQMIARRRHDVVNLSVLFAAGVAGGQRRSGHPLAPSWVRFTRWWHEVATGGTDALVGVVRVYQALTATTPALSGLIGEVRAALPTVSEDPQWWDRGRLTGHGFVEFDVASKGGRYDRAIVVVASVDDAGGLSAYTWSRGDPGLPPLARYLLHAAKLRHQARVRDSAAQVAVTLSRDEVVDLQRGLAVVADHMGASGVEPFGEDECLGRWLRERLADDRGNLAPAQRRPRAAFSSWSPVKPPNPSPTAPTSWMALSASPIRFGFGVDVVGFRIRSAAEQAVVGQRLAALLGGVLDDLDVPANLADGRLTGGAALAFLPPDVAPERTLVRLLRSWWSRLARDNQTGGERMRLRLSAVLGPVSVTALGPDNTTVAEAGRLLGSRALRQELDLRPTVDLATFVSDPLYQVASAGYPEFHRYRFESRFVDEKHHAQPAWLWTAPEASA